MLCLYLPTCFETFTDMGVSEIQPDKLDNLSACLMHELMQMVSKVSPDGLARARNQVDFILYYFLSYMSSISIWLVPPQMVASFIKISLLNVQTG